MSVTSKAAGMSWLVKLIGPEERALETLELPDVGGGHVAAVADDDVVEAIVVGIADADAVRVDVRPDAEIAEEAEPAVRELCEHGEVRDRVGLSGHDDEVVQAVIGDIADLEIVVAGVLGRIHSGRPETAGAVIEHHGHGVGAPTDAGHIERGVAVEKPQPDPVTVDRGGQGR